jgi:hypothetical protein
MMLDAGCWMLGAGCVGVCVGGEGEKHFSFLTFWIFLTPLFRFPAPLVHRSDIVFYRSGTVFYRSGTVILSFRQYWLNVIGVL